MPNQPQNRFQLIEGGLEREFRLSGVPVTVVTLQSRPDKIDVQLREEDTHMVLSVDPALYEPRETLSQLTDHMSSFKPAKPGSVVVRRGREINLLAIVHDLDLDPSWRESWIAEALAKALELARRRGLYEIATPLLGTVHGRLALGRALELLRDALAVSPPLPGSKIWLVVKRAQIGDVIDRLHKMGADII